jgi:predicted Rdx family selenoprotein
LPRAARAAAAIKQQLREDVELVKGSGGIFVVEVDGRIVARKTAERGFPSDEEVVAAVRQAV